MREVKCEHCGHWTDGKQPLCGHCGKRLNDRNLKEQEALQQENPGQMPLIKIDPNAPFWKRGMLQVLRLLQLLFFSLISLIASIASSTAH